MTGAPAPARRRRWSKKGIRALAWFTGGVTFLASGAVLAETPKPAAERANAAVKPAKRTIVRRIERRIIVDPPTVVVVAGSGGGGAPVPTAGSGSSSSSSSSTTTSGGSSGGQQPAPPATTTGGS